MDVVGKWVLSFGNRSRPSRLVILHPDRTITSMNGPERYWSFLDHSLTLADAHRSTLLVFSLARAKAGFFPGRSSLQAFTPSETWLSRYDGVEPEPTGAFAPVAAGPLARTVRTSAEFRSAWRAREDFSVVIAPRTRRRSIPISAHGINMRETVESRYFADVLDRSVREGYDQDAVFFSVFFDCLLADGRVVIDRNGRVRHETTQFTDAAHRHADDVEFALRGSDSDETTSRVDLAWRRPQGRVCHPTFLFNRLHNSYGHWLVQSLPNALVLDWIRSADTELAGSLLLASKAGYDREAFRAETLSLLALDNPRLTSPGGVVAFDTMVVPSLHRNHSFHWVGIEDLFEQLRRATSHIARSELPRRIFASRVGQNRGFADDHGIGQVLTRHGFTPIVGGQVPLAWQIAAFANAEAVFGAYGSNMSNISYCRPGTHVIDALDDRYRHPFWNYMLANAAALDYCPIVVPVAPGEEEVSFHQRRIHLSPDVLDDVLAKVLGQTSR